MICIDSDCIIDFLKGKDEAVKIVSQHRGTIFTTEINVFEIFFGVYNKKQINEEEELAAKHFFNVIPILPFDEKCGEISSKILTSLFKEGNALSQNDCFISSVMIKHGCNTILTRNVKDFTRVKGVKVITY